MSGDQVGKNVVQGITGIGAGVEGVEVSACAELVPERRRHTARHGADGLPGVQDVAHVQNDGGDRSARGRLG